MQSNRIPYHAMPAGLDLPIYTCVLLQLCLRFSRWPRSPRALPTRPTHPSSVQLAHCSATRYASPLVPSQGFAHSHV